MTTTHRDYVPAAGRRWALPFYDLLTKLLGADRVRGVLAGQVVCRPGDRVLDVGCGTGSLVIVLKRAHPDAEIAGLDPDAGALAIAGKKAQRAGLAVRLDQGFADALPYSDASFDHVVSSLMYHHLRGAEKEGMLREVRRVLTPGGRFHMLDFAGPGAEKRSWLARHLHSHRALRANDQEQVLAAMRAAGLIDAQVTGERATHAGKLLFYQAAAPDLAA